MKPLKNTTFLEAIAAAIQYEKDRFDFYLRISEELENEYIKEFFQNLAEDVEDHIKIIEDFYKRIEGTQGLPNLKQLSAIHKFHSTTILRLMRKLDRNKKLSILGDELLAIETTLREGEDATNFYSKIKNKFKDPNIKLLFQILSNYYEENKSLIESHILFLKEKNHDQESYYWQDEDLMKEAAKPVLIMKKKKKSKTKKK